MRRKIEKVASSCWECPFLHYTRGKDISSLDGWSCMHESSGEKQVIDQRHRQEFAEQYPKGFPSWCPLPILDDIDPARPEPAPKEAFKWVLTNGIRYDLKDCTAYPAPNGEVWNFFAIRSGTGRTTAESYTEYKSLQEIQDMFTRTYGFGGEWKKEPIKSQVKRSK
jgi:hypothetical protein